MLNFLAKRTSVSSACRRRWNSTGTNKITAATSSSLNYVGDIFMIWEKNPDLVHPSWNKYFSECVNTATATTNHSSINRSPTQSSSSSNQQLLNEYRLFGHKNAKIDPLSLTHVEQLKKSAVSLTDRITQLTNASELKAILEKIYCASVAIEFMHLNNVEMRNWLLERVENSMGHYKLECRESRSNGLRNLMEATMFERFASKHFPFETAFYADGCESFIPALAHVIQRSSDQGVEDFVIGIAHRGRSALLCCLLQHDLTQFFHLFNPDVRLEDKNSGDSKYHLGGYLETINPRTKTPIRVSLLSNASHLESVSPVAQGRVKGMQVDATDLNGDKSLCILVHGDAAMCGQGVTYETAHMAHIDGFSTQGIVHIVANNQLGFTSERHQYCSSAYCTDVLKIMDAPVFHINADDMDAVLYFSDLAAQCRGKFKKDVVLDVVGYRRYGHNEGDDPKITQPVMYKTIEKQQSTLTLFKDECIKNGVVDDAKFQDWLQGYECKLKNAYEKAKNDQNPVEKVWWDMPELKNEDQVENKKDFEDSGIERETLTTIAHTVCKCEATDTFTPLKTVTRLLNKRFEMFKSKNQIDFALAEALAFGSILLDGKNIRLTGQDSERGTFSQRHGVLHDQEIIGKVRVPLNELSGKSTGKITLLNTLLSEYAALGHQYGYSLNRPNTLCLWEAQYGDFANCAQCIIDQYVVSGADKWHHKSGLVMLLPHGLDGGGPEHSSCRPERFLQMSNEPIIGMEDTGNREFQREQLKRTNIIVVNCTTAANYFHMLRRHSLLPFLRKLIVLAPKSLLRSPNANSPIDHFTEGTQFRSVIDEEPSQTPPKTLMFCSGKVYYDLIDKRKSLNQSVDDVRIVRLEQLTPFPSREVKEICAKGASKLIWVQEEHQNMGAFTFVQPKFNHIANQLNLPSIEYAGRGVCETPVTCNRIRLLEQTNQLLQHAFNI